ncbi:MAG TPA: RagB/SusD family nutrient uptake outer membrane protein [Kofleriaceae bacterium]|nr:RagB/SusD family nutrient uptake outer membrane protein [Kofleriaceae bacterium]
MRRLASLLIVATLGTTIASCDLDVPDLNNPGIGDLEDNPTPSAVSAACTGLLIGNRRNQAAANGFVAQLSILARDAYNFDQADPRFIGELLQGTLQAGSPFGGNFWTGPYANIRLANTILKATDKVAEFSDQEKAAIRGFTNTIKALDLLEVAVTRDDIGAVIDTDRPLDAELAPIVSKDQVYTEIVRLLDEGATDLQAAGDAFPFALSNGYAGFDTPATFRTFNRAIRARVSAYMGDYPTVLAALAESFIDDTAVDLEGLDTGVYYSYSTGAGDVTNNLINPNIYAHPSVAADAQTKTGGVKDARFTRKVTTTDEPGSAQGLTSDLVFTLYTSPDSPVPLIRNEELILLRAEAKFFTGDVAGAIDDLNLVRVNSGGLAPLTGTPNEATFIDELLYERRYSLLFEWGHRWIDVRRFGRVESLPLDMPGDTRNIRYPIPLSECNARPADEPACDKISTGG